MTIKNRLALADAEKLAHEVCKLFESSCQRFEIAGSIRRKKPDVGDIEFVCIPRTDPSRVNLFGEPIPDCNLQVERAEDLLRNGTVAHRLDVNGRLAFGDKMQRLLYRGFALDVFSCTAEQWGCTMLVRTGSAAFSQRFATKQRHGGLMPDHMRLKGWRVCDEDGTPLATPTERDVFRVIGLPFIAPEDRR